MPALELRPDVDRQARSTAFQTATPYVSEAAGASRNKLAVALLAVYIFLLVSRVLDVSPIWFLHIPLMLLVVLTVVLISRGNLQSLFSLKITKWFAAASAWVLIAFPFSEWRGGSMSSVFTDIQAFVIFLIILQIVKNREDWRRVAGGYAYAVLVASFLSFVKGHVVDGRFALDNGSLADPNEFALILAVGLPFWWLKASEASGFRKVFFILCTTPIFVTFARTGSRSGLLCMATLFLVTMIFASMAQRMLMAVLAVAVIVGGALFLPGYLKMRFTTFFAEDSAHLDAKTQFRIDADLSSTAGREMLLKQGIRMTFEHPLLGVGPGVFAGSAWNQRKAETGRGGWAQVTHNTYVQISSETGIPGFIFFVVTVALCLKYTLADYRRLLRENPALAKMHLYLFTSLAGMSVGIFFLSIAYTHTLAVMFALAATLHRIAIERQEESAETEPVLSGPARISSTSAPASRPPKKSEFRFGRRRNA